MEDKVTSIWNIVNSISPILSAILTGIITFLITKYTYHRNRPLDKLEIAYNNIYFPVYCLVIDTVTPDEFIMSECDRYFELYKKYIDNSTVRAYNTLKEDTKDQKRYDNFKKNILKKNSYLRINLGYLESGVFEIYAYSSDLVKRLMKCLLSFTFTYIVLMLAFIFIGLEAPYQITYILMIIGIPSFIFLIYQTLRLLPWGIKKVVNLLKMIIFNFKRYLVGKINCISERLNKRVR